MFRAWKDDDGTQTSLSLACDPKACTHEFWMKIGCANVCVLCGAETGVRRNATSRERLGRYRDEDPTTRGDEPRRVAGWNETVEHMSSDSPSAYMLDVAANGELLTSTVPDRLVRRFALTNAIRNVLHMSKPTDSSRNLRTRFRQQKGIHRIAANNGESPDNETAIKSMLVGMEQRLERHRKAKKCSLKRACRCILRAAPPKLVSLVGLEVATEQIQESCIRRRMRRRCKQLAKSLPAKTKLRSRYRILHLAYSNDVPEDCADMLTDEERAELDNGTRPFDMLTRAEQLKARALGDGAEERDEEEEDSDGDENALSLHAIIEDALAVVEADDEDDDEDESVHSVESFGAVTQQDDEQVSFFGD
jgi:hypothetical protein